MPGEISSIATPGAPVGPGIVFNTTSGAGNNGGGAHPARMAGKAARVIGGDAFASIVRAAGRSSGSTSASRSASPASGPSAKACRGKSGANKNAPIPTAIRYKSRRPIINEDSCQSRAAIGSAIELALRDCATDYNRSTLFVNPAYERTLDSSSSTLDLFCFLSDIYNSAQVLQLMGLSRVSHSLVAAD